jgi:universal stress protein A
MNDIKRIVVVTRSTKYCEKAVQYGISIAQKYRAELYVLHLMHDPFGLEGWQLAVPSLKSIQDEYKNMRAKAKVDLDRMVDTERAKGMSIRVILEEGDPEKEVLRFVRENRIDLLVTLAHEEGHLERLLFGRLNEVLHRKLPCSLLLVKQEPGPVE